MSAIHSAVSGKGTGQMSESSPTDLSHHPKRRPRSRFQNKAQWFPRAGLALASWSQPLLVRYETLENRDGNLEEPRNDFDEPQRAVHNLENRIARNQSQGINLTLYSFGKTNLHHGLFRQLQHSPPPMPSFSWRLSAFALIHAPPDGGASAPIAGRDRTGMTS